VTELTPIAIARAIGVAEPVVDGLGHGRIEPPPCGMEWGAGRGAAGTKAAASGVTLRIDPEP
jgi:hypothetical protein